LGHRQINFVITVTLGPGPLVLEARRISTVRIAMLGHGHH
jgi:hypothetical protein